MALCNGNDEDHCCWIDGNVCPHLEENTVEGRRWACGLRRELGSWEAVHVDVRYLTDVQPCWDRVDPEGACGEFPAPGKRCATCGVSGDG